MYTGTANLQCNRIKTRWTLVYCINYLHTSSMFSMLWLHSWPISCIFDVRVRICLYHVNCLFLLIICLSRYIYTFNDLNVGTTFSKQGEYVVGRIYMFIDLFTNKDQGNLLSLSYSIYYSKLVIFSYFSYLDTYLVPLFSKLVVSYTQLGSRPIPIFRFPYTPVCLHLYCCLHNT